MPRIRKQLIRRLLVPLLIASVGILGSGCTFHTSVKPAVDKMIPSNLYYPSTGKTLRVREVRNTTGQKLLVENGQDKGLEIFTDGLVTALRRSGLFALVVKDDVADLELNCEVKEIRISDKGFFNLIQAGKDRTLTVSVVFKLLQESSDHTLLDKMYSGRHSVRLLAGLIYAGSNSTKLSQLIEQASRQIFDKAIREISSVVRRTVETESGEIIGGPPDRRVEAGGPCVWVSAPQPGSLTSAKRVTVRGVVLDDGEITGVWINGRRLTTRRGVTVEPSVNFTVRDRFAFEARVSLSPGENRFVVEAEDNDGNKGTKTVTVTHVVGGVPVVSRSLPTMWGIVVGISDYRNPNIEDLKFAEKDALDFYNFLRSPDGGAISYDHLTFLVGPKATSAKILGEMNRFLKRAFDEDMVIIYFAMHGVPDPDGNDLYFLGYDSDPNNLIGTAISKTVIDKLLSEAVRAKKVVFITDACHSGGLGSLYAFRSGEAAVTNKLLGEISRARNGIAMLSASSASEFSREDAKWGGGHGVFTYYLLRGLKGEADTDPDGIVTIRELFDYTYQKVSNATGGSQHPELKGIFDNNLPVSVVK